MDNSKKPTRDLLFSCALIIMAGAITYFAYALLSVSKQIPAILDQVTVVSQQVDRTTKNIEPILVTVPSILEQVPDILKTVDKTTDSIPLILAEVEKIRVLVPAVLNEAESVRGELPKILERVDTLQKQVSQIQKQLPSILKTVNGITHVVGETNQQVEKIVPLVPKVLDEVKITRDQIPSYLTRVEQIVENTRGISEEAGKGAVTGFFKGIVSTPFELLKGTESTVRASLKNEKLLTDEDFQLVYEASAKLLQSETNKTQAWGNPSTGNGGMLTVIRTYEYKGEHCKTIKLDFKTRNGSKDSTENNVCKNSQGHWKPVEK